MPVTFKFDATEFKFSLSKAQWYHCLNTIIRLYHARGKGARMCDLLNDVYRYDTSTFEPGYCSPSDFAWKLRDVFFWWSHIVVKEKAKQNKAPRDPPTWWEMDSDHFYNFCNAARVLFFEHGRRDFASQLRANGRFQWFPPHIIAAFKGEDDARRKSWVDRWENIKSRQKEVRSADRMLVPSPYLEVLAESMTRTVYNMVLSRLDITHYVQANDEERETVTTAIMAAIMVEEPVQAFQLWLQAPPPLAADALAESAAHNGSSGSPAQPVTVTPSQAEDATKAIAASVVNLRIKQVLENSDQTQSFRASIAVREAMKSITVKVENGTHDGKELKKLKRGALNALKKRNKKKRK